MSAKLFHRCLVLQGCDIPWSTTTMRNAGSVSAAVLHGLDLVEEAIRILRSHPGPCDPSEMTPDERARVVAAFAISDMVTASMGPTFNMAAVAHSMRLTADIVTDRQ